MTPAYLFFAAAICACVFRCAQGLMDGPDGDIKDALVNVQAFFLLIGIVSATMAVASCFVLAQVAEHVGLQLLQILKGTP